MVSLHDITVSARARRNSDTSGENGPLFGIILHEAPRPSTIPFRRRLNYTTAFCAVCLAVWLAAEVWEIVR